jgi:hypothetical protein
MSEPRGTRVLPTLYNGVGHSQPVQPVILSGAKNPYSPRLEYATSRYGFLSLSSSEAKDRPHFGRAPQNDAV